MKHFNNFLSYAINKLTSGVKSGGRRLFSEDIDDHQENNFRNNFYILNEFEETMQEQGNITKISHNYIFSIEISISETQHQSNEETIIIPFNKSFLDNIPILNTFEKTMLKSSKIALLNATITTFYCDIFELKFDFEFIFKFDHKSQVKQHYRFPDYNMKTKKNSSICTIFNCENILIGTTWNSLNGCGKEDVLKSIYCKNNQTKNNTDSNYFTNHGDIKISKKSFILKWLWRNRYSNWDGGIEMKDDSFRLINGNCDKNIYLINNDQENVCISKETLSILKERLEQDVFKNIPYIKLDDFIIINILNILVPKEIISSSNTKNIIVAKIYLTIEYQFSKSETINNYEYFQ